MCRAWDFAVPDLQPSCGHPLDRRQPKQNGDEWGNGNCQLFMYGDDADKIFDVITPLLLSHEAPAVSYAIKRYGPPGAPEQMVHLRADSRPG